MREAKRRKVHAPECKAKVGVEALRWVKTITELGQEFGVHPVDECFAFYNGERPHQSLGNKTPDVVSNRYRWRGGDRG